MVLSQIVADWDLISKVKDARVHLFWNFDNQPKKKAYILELSKVKDT